MDLFWFITVIDDFYLGILEKIENSKIIFCTISKPNENLYLLGFFPSVVSV